MAVALSDEENTSENTADNDTSEDKEEFSSVVKGIHSQLRAQFGQGIPISTLWSHHIQDDITLQTYAHAMHSLATGPWKKHGGGRIQWCVDMCKEYFHHKCALEKFLMKDLKRKEFGNSTQLDETLLPKNVEEVMTIVTSFQNRKLALLDVGSCYNPFNEYNDLFNVTAIDIAPAIKGVLKCDFLNVKILPQTTRDKPALPFCCTEDMIVSIEECSQDIVIFSLLLSYFPSTLQRMQCCINAHSILAPHGILLIVTADSSHQNKHVDMIKSWTVAIEKIGFHRWKYFKDVHLHCLGFRKTSLESNYDLVFSEFHTNLYIQQDESGIKNYAKQQ